MFHFLRHVYPPAQASQLILQVFDAFPQLQDHGDAGKIDSEIALEAQNALQAVDGGYREQWAGAGFSRWLEQAEMHKFLNALGVQVCRVG